MRDSWFYSLPFYSLSLPLLTHGFTAYPEIFAVRNFHGFCDCLRYRKNITWKFRSDVWSGALKRDFERHVWRKNLKCLQLSLSIIAIQLFVDITFTRTFGRILSLVKLYAMKGKKEMITILMQWHWRKLELVQWATFHGQSHAFAPFSKAGWRYCSVCDWTTKILCWFGARRARGTLQVHIYRWREFRKESSFRLTQDGLGEIEGLWAVQKLNFFCSLAADTNGVNSKFEKIIQWPK